MRRRGEVKCYHCGHVSGTLEWNGRPGGPGIFTPTGGSQHSVVNLGQLRCSRCGGPVFLDEFEVVTIDTADLLAAARDERPARREVAAGA